VIEKRFNGSDNSTFSGTKIDWGYDGLGRLTSETRDAGNNGQDGEDYVATFSYDLAGNRLSKDFNSANNAHDESITYLYDNRDRLSSEDSTVNANDTSYGYDNNGSITSETRNGTTTGYVWDLRNRLAGIDANNNGSLNDSVDTKYGYDEEGQRVSEQPGNSGATARYFVNDKDNPTGYPQIIEERTGTSPGSATFNRSYVIGLSILGQYDTTNGTLYLLKDGHGSTRALLNPSGTVGDTYDYQAFSEAIGFDPTTAKTIDLFGGDAEEDPTSGFYYHDKRWRQNFRFISMDDYAGTISDPLTLHKYSFVASDPNLVDPTGNMFIPPGIERWIRKNIAKGAGLDLIIRALIGIRATYVFGNAYIVETYGDLDVPEANLVDINRQVFTIQNLPPVIQEGVNYALRPDIVDRSVQTVYEVKTEEAVTLGKWQIKPYIALLNLRDGTLGYHGGDWQPQQAFYEIGLPWFGDLFSIDVTARNAGEGVIAYDAGNKPELLAIMLRLFWEASRGVATKTGGDAARAGGGLGIGTLLALISFV
jgi:YD repeat-containing protein